MARWPRAEYPGALYHDFGARCRGRVLQANSSRCLHDVCHRRHHERQHAPVYLLKYGVLEWWSLGVMGVNSCLVWTQYSITPFLQYSN